MVSEKFLPSPTEILLSFSLYQNVDLSLETRDERVERLAKEMRADEAREALRAAFQERVQRAAAEAAPLSNRPGLSVSKASPPVRPVTGPSPSAPPSPTEGERHLQKFQSFRGPFEAYCPDCGDERPFKGTDSCLTTGFAPNVFSMAFRCQWDQRHTLVFHFWSDGASLQKVGQIPSVKDLAEFELRQYQPHLDRDLLHRGMLDDLRRGIGLFSHGIGAGSFVYLRRVFERLVAEAESAARSATPPVAAPARMEEKILALREYLPEALVENRVTYGLLSDGLHNLDLTEEECLQRFPALRAGIELILDGQIQRAAKEKKEKSTRETLAELAGKLKPKQ